MINNHGTLNNKVAVITGSTRGFGLAMARAFVAQGAAVVVSSRSLSAVEQAVSELAVGNGRVAGKTCDVTDLSQVQALAEFALEKFGSLDIWVNNAGSSPPYGPTLHVDPHDFVQATQTNTLGVYYGSLVSMRYFLERNRGKLINVLGRGERGPVPMQNAYSASKAWVKSFTLALAEEYKDSGVGVFAVSPGMMDTEMLLDVKVVAGFEDRLKSMAGIVQALSQPPEIPAQRAVWLASAVTDGRTGLVAREMTGVKVMGRFLRLGFNRLMHRPARPVEVKVSSVPAAFPSIMAEKR
jgi:glucose 1-dehydrogenase